MRITLISDPHTRFKELTPHLPGGDLILCAGDVSSRGYKEEIKEFCKWYEFRNYDTCIFIPGNHDFCFQDEVNSTLDIVKDYGVECLIDNLYLEYNGVYGEAVKIYGSPWQPEFCNWAFNLPRNGWELEQKWTDIPENTDILITHGPPWGILDVVKGRTDHLGCELLAERIKVLKPKIHVFGHIHTGYGYKFDGTTHFFNASVLNEQYNYVNKPFTFDWNPKTNELNFV